MTFLGHISLFGTTTVHRKNAFVLKTAFRISLKIYLATYDYLLDSEKSKVFFNMGYREKNPGHTRPNTSDKKFLQLGNVIFGRKFLARIDLGRKLNGPNG
jgi:hypothetical protein